MQDRRTCRSWRPPGDFPGRADGDAQWGSLRRRRVRAPLHSNAFRQQPGDDDEEAAAVGEGGPTALPVDGKQAALSTEVTLGLYEAARLGDRITFPLVNRGPILDQAWGNPSVRQREADE